LKSLNGIGKNILLIGDCHFPYAHRKAISFIKKIKKEYQIDMAVHMGDEVDNHAISFHDSDADLHSAGDELLKALIKIKELEAVFPKLYLCDSNHGSLALRRLKRHGIPMKYLKSLQDIYGTPNWEWHESYKLRTAAGPVYLCHGKSASYGKLCKEVGMSTAQGHHHGKFEITWHQSATTEKFNCFTGCLIDRDSLAFAYGQNNLAQPILGSVVIDRQGIPHLIKLD